MIHNNKVYANADEKFVKATIIYADINDTLYHDVDCTVPVLTTEIEELFLNGMVIRDHDGVYCAPSSLFEGIVEITVGGTGYNHTTTAPTEE